ncbi:MAG TPA: cytochrome C oxidase subunit IV family protein [Thermoanaerobaculia bacterium]|nr:cytochrome C oxidase subunit IV family protein [Thermoanaerobaculia bacterium]
MSGHSVEEIKRETRVYLMVFVGLAILTVVTVAVSKLHLTTGPAILVALLIASVKGFLVAGYFMHLLSEKKLIYSVLALTVVFLLVLMLLPLGSAYGGIGG